MKECIETIHPTTHSNPVYIVDGVVHYAVANMPGAVPTTSTYALTNETLPYVVDLANRGYPTALLDNLPLRAGLSIAVGKVVQKSIAEQFGLPYKPIDEALACLPSKVKA